MRSTFRVLPQQAQGHPSRSASFWAGSFWSRCCMCCPAMVPGHPSDMNIQEIAEILRTPQVAHLAQHFKGAAAAGPGACIGQRSFLGGLLPESLLHVLTSYGAGAFAAALCGDADTPELVWTHRMRAQRLIPQVGKAYYCVIP